MTDNFDSLKPPATGAEIDEDANAPAEGAEIDDAIDASAEVSDDFSLKPPVTGQ